jgi:hypothetical protein
MVTGMPLHKALNGLREELELAQAQHGNDLRLQIDSIELELTLELGAEVKIEGKASTAVKVPWLVVGKAEVGGAGAAHGAHTHRVALTIKPLGVVTPEPTATSPNGDAADGRPAVPEASAPPMGPLLIADDQPRIDRSAR